MIIKHVACEGPGLFRKTFEKHGLKCRIHEIWKNSWLPYPKDFSLIVVMGGPMNVYETARYPFLIAEDEFLRAALKMEIPILGVCLGGQLLAKALGARVSRNKDKEIGHFAVNLTRAGKYDPVFNGFPEVFPVFQWHGDTFALPPRAKRLAFSSLCENQAFRAGKSYGLQFHLEITLQIVSAWCRVYANELEAAGVNADALIAGSRQKEDIYVRQTEKLVNNLLAELDIA